jgi:FtsP/CotA-like multicopper oxidase with cupredoxin domain
MLEPLDRRRFLMLTGSGTAAAVLAACGDKSSALVRSSDPVISRLERRRRKAGAQVVARRLDAAPVKVDLAGREVSTWAYGDGIPGPELRVSVGDVLRVKLANKLPEPTTIHWHGIAIRNDMDGVHDLTQPVIKPGEGFTYEFALDEPGTYFFHPHTALQLDRGLYAPLIVEDPHDPVVSDVDQVLVLDDWLDGIGSMSPDKALAKLRRRGAMGGMGNMGSNASGGMSGMTSKLLGGDAGDVDYPLHLINGRPPADRPTVSTAPNSRVRLRIINAASDTAYRFAVGGHRLTVTHADGFPVHPVEVDSLLIGMGERYDVVVTATSGAWPIVAAAEGKDGAAIAVLRTRDAPSSAAPPVNVRPRELNGRLLRYGDLVPTKGAALTDRRTDRSYRVDLTGDMMSYTWGIGGKAFPKSSPLEVHDGQRVRLELRNRSMMWHPIHLHGHTFALDATGARKDTVNVLPRTTQIVELDADNPGQWMLHCHNTYHLEQGMATTLSYRR